MTDGKGDGIRYVVPEEGAPMWFDRVAMPLDAPHEKAAYAFMNYLLRPEAMAGITNPVRLTACASRYGRKLKTAIEDVMFPARRACGVYLCFCALIRH